MIVSGRSCPRNRGSAPPACQSTSSMRARRTARSAARGSRGRSRRRPQSLHCRHRGRGSTASVHLADDEGANALGQGPLARTPRTRPSKVRDAPIPGATSRASSTLRTLPAVSYTHLTLPTICSV
eukprot:5457103-Prymnesium_polylepis.3